MTLAIYDLNQYLWEVPLLGLQDQFATNVGLSKPFFPVQEVPEAINGAHIVYTVSTIPDNEIWQSSRDEILYRIFGRTIDQTTEIANAIVRSLRKFDESAEEVNWELSRMATPRLDYTFKYIKIIGNNSPQPRPGEAGYYMRPLFVRSYYVENLL